jgi:hypothetical protein
MILTNVSRHGIGICFTLAAGGSVRGVRFHGGQLHKVSENFSNFAALSIKKSLSCAARAPQARIVVVRNDFT